MTDYARLFAAGVGGLDLASGVGLVLAPGWTLARLFIEPPSEPSALGLVRLLGALVGGLGVAYVWAAARPGEGRLRALLQLTLPVRAGLGVVAAVAVAAGWVGKGWLTIAAADLLLVGIQMMLLNQGAGRDR